jgi:hypothetical protein
MMKDPVLAVDLLPPGDGYHVPRTFRVVGGLNYIKGNSSPYFSLTYEAHREGFPNQCWSGGAGHEEILKWFPKFADLAALHLSDMGGAPMHAVENGLYKLAGAIGGNLGQQYHAGNSGQNFPLPADKLDPAKPWQDTEYRNPTPDECLQMFADHARCSIEEAIRIANRVNAAGAGNAKAVLTEEMDAMRPRWKAEAEAAIAKYSLKVYGDEWTGKEV